jgi:hypothetical protein
MPKSVKKTAPQLADKHVGRVQAPGEPDEPEVKLSPTRRQEIARRGAMAKAAKRPERS